MSYASGINSLQQTISSITPSDAKPAAQVNASDSVSKSSAGSIANVERVDQTNLSSTGGLVAQALESSDTRSAKVASATASLRRMLRTRSSNLCWTKHDDQSDPSSYPR
jgi:hypothetical protein